MISKSISVSRKFNSIPGNSGKLKRFPQLLYLLILPHVDDFGRMSGDPETVKALCAPMFNESIPDFSGSLVVLHTVKLVDWYEVEGEKYLQIIDFDEHQTGLHKRTTSKIPGSSGKFPELPAQGKGTKGKGREGKVPGKPGNDPPARKVFLRHVMLSNEEHDRARQVLGSLCPEYMERLDLYLEKIGPDSARARSYKSHCAVMESWWRSDKKKEDLGGWDGKSAPQN